jgi:hypothetical protein
MQRTDPDPAALSLLIGDIYDAALDQVLWTNVLKQTCTYVQGIAAALVAHDSLDKNAQFFFSYGDDPYYSKLYVDTYVKINPIMPTAVVQANVGETSAYLDFISQEEYHATRFYREWAGPQGYVDAVQTTLDKSVTAYAAATVMRHERHGVIDDEARRRMSLLGPHFRRAVSIGKVINLR